MPGNIIFKPLEAHFKDEKVEPYLKFTLGNNKAKTQVTTASKDTNAHWDECLTLNRSHEEFCDIHVKNKASPTKKEIGIIRVPLAEIEKCGKTCKWYDIGLHGKPAGQLLLEIDCDNSNITNQPASNLSGQSKMTKDDPMKFGGSGEEVSGQSKMNKDDPMKVAGGGFVQDKEGISGQSKMNKDESMKFGGSDFVQNKEGVSGQSKMNKEDFTKVGGSGFVQDKEGISGSNKAGANMQDFDANIAEKKKRFGA